MFQRTGFSPRITATVMSPSRNLTGRVPKSSVSPAGLTKLRITPAPPALRGQKFSAGPKTPREAGLPCLHRVREFLGRFSLDRRRAPRVSRGTDARNNSLTVSQADDSIPWALMSRGPQERGACGGGQPGSRGPWELPALDFAPLPCPAPAKTTHPLAL